MKTDTKKLYKIYGGGLILALAVIALFLLWGMLQVQDELRSQKLLLLGYVSEKMPQEAEEFALLLLDEPDKDELEQGKSVLVSMGMGTIGYENLGKAFSRNLFWKMFMGLGIFAGGLFACGCRRERQMAEDISAMTGAVRRAADRGHGDMPPEGESCRFKRAKMRELYSEIRRSMDAFEREKAALKREKTELSTYFENISHQIKTPLTALSLAQEQLLLMETQPDKADLLEKCGQKIEFMQEIIRLLLQSARLNSDRTAFRLERSSVYALAERLHRAVAELSASKKIRLEITVTGGEYAVFEKFWLQEAAVNILKNAVEASPASGVVSLTIENSEDCLDMYIADEGKGIAEEEYGDIFRRFYTRKISQADSAGIGLHMAWQVAGKHGGKLELLNSPETGSCFRLRIPQLPGKNKSSPQ